MAEQFFCFKTCPICKEYYLDEDEASAPAIVDGYMTDVCMACVRRFTEKPLAGFTKRPVITEEINEGLIDRDNVPEDGAA